MITLDGVTLDYPIISGSKSFRLDLYKASIGGLLRRGETKKSIVVRALEDISLVVANGDRLGLLGPNGAGKSSLLRLMAGIYEPSRGSVKTSGRISALFNTSLGMDPDDTGLENIMHIGMFLGMKTKEIKNKTEEIAEFAELGDFLNLPVRTYSTGMQVRLSFAIATSINPGILLLDEGIVAGDAKFIEKANRRIDELISRSSSLVIASHAEELIRDMCNKAVLLEHGRIITVGDVETVLECYRERRQHY